MDAESWNNVTDILDFDVRSKILDFILYLYVKSASVLDQHFTLLGRTQKGMNYYAVKSDKSEQKTTKTILLKPFLSERDLQKLENNNVFKVRIIFITTLLILD